MRHHTGKDVAENIFSNLSAYFHQSVPKYLAEMFEVDEKDVQDDHDWLHKCGISE